MTNERAWFAAIGGGLFGLCLACSSGVPAGTSVRKDVTAADVCRRLVAAGEARGCHGAEGKLFEWSRYELVALHREGFARRFYDAKEYDEAVQSIEAFAPAADDLPNGTVLAPDDKLIVEWSSKTPDAWDTCMASAKSAARCARQQPKLYAAAKRVLDATRKATVATYEVVAPAASSSTSSANRPR